MKRVKPESQVQNLILDWLAARGILAFRFNTGAVVASHNGKQRMVRYGVPGMADILAFPKDRGNPSWASFERGRVTWIECKAPNGKQSELQKSFQAQVESHGHRYVLAKTLEDVKEAIDISNRSE